MENDNVLLQYESCSKMELLQKAFDQACAKNCDKIWHKSPIELLSQNPIHPFVYVAAVMKLLSNCGGKFRNLMLIGPTNCEKT